MDRKKLFTFSIFLHFQFCWNQAKFRIMWCKSRSISCTFFLTGFVNDEIENEKDNRQIFCEIAPILRFHFFMQYLLETSCYVSAVTAILLRKMDDLIPFLFFLVKCTEPLKYPDGIINYLINDTKKCARPSIWSFSIWR